MEDNVFNEVKNNEQARSALLSRQKYLFDMNTYIAESKAEGEYEKAIKIAVRMLKKHIPIEEIADLTELTETEINKIKSNL